jgi:ABC-type polysaccharide transport system permease subunit
MEYKIKFKNHFIVAWIIWSSPIVMLVFMYIFGYTDRLSFKVFGIVLGLINLPGIFLHLEYFLNDHKKTVIIINNSITIKKREITETFQFNEIKKIILYKSRAADTGIHLTPIQSYYYLRILTNNGKEIIITCLIEPKIEKIVKEMPNIPFQRIGRYFASIYFEDQRE